MTDEAGSTALHMAARTGWLEGAMFLVEQAGASPLDRCVLVLPVQRCVHGCMSGGVRARCPRSRCTHRIRDHVGATPAHHAAYGDKVLVLKWFVTMVDRAWCVLGDGGVSGSGLHAR